LPLFAEIYVFAEFCGICYWLVIRGQVSLILVSHRKLITKVKVKVVVVVVVVGVVAVVVAE